MHPAEPAPDASRDTMERLGLQVIVRRADGAETQPHSLEGVAAQIVLALLTHQAEINGYAKGALEFDWGPNGLRGRMHPMWDHTIAPALVQQFAAVLVQPHVRPYNRGWVRFDDNSLYLQGSEQMPRRPDPGA